MIVQDTIEKTLEASDREILNGENHDKREFVRKILNYPAMMVPDRIATVNTDSSKML